MLFLETNTSVDPCLVLCSCDDTRNCERKHNLSLPYYLYIAYISFHVVSRYEKLKFDVTFCSISLSPKPRNLLYISLHFCLVKESCFGYLL